MPISRVVLAGVAASLTLLLAPAAQAGQCRDPWITQAIQEVTGREPNGSHESGECTYTQYGGGSWSNYPQLKGYVQARLKPSFSTGPQPGGNVQYRTTTIPKATFDSLQKQYTIDGVKAYYNGQWWRLIGMDGATVKLIGNDAGS